MGPNSPKSFSRCDKNICLTGLLPSISLEASEKTVRNEICEVIHSSCSPNLSSIEPQDFEFISVHGKHAAIPQCRNGFQWNGRAVKELAGSGSVYVRLMKDCVSYSDDLPPGPCAISSSSSKSWENDRSLPENVPVELSESNSLPGCSESNFINLDSDEDVSDSITSSAPTSVSVNTTLSSSTRSCSAARLYPVVSTDNTDTVASTSNVSASSNNTDMVASIDNTDTDASTSNADTAATTSNITTNSDNTTFSSVSMANFSTTSSASEDCLLKLQELFSNMSKEQLQCIYELCSCFNRAVEALLEGPSLDALRSLAVSRITVPPEACPKIRLHADDDDDDWMEAAFTFYKNRSFDKKAGIRISIRGQPAVDTGGIRRQFFSVVFRKLALGSTGIFDGPPNRLRPAYKTSMLTSGTLSTIGTMIAHSFLLDGQGFPFLAEYCYYYIVGCCDLALLYVTIDDTTENVKRIVSEVSYILK